MLTIGSVVTLLLAFVGSFEHRFTVSWGRDMRFMLDFCAQTTFSSVHPSILRHNVGVLPKANLAMQPGGCTGNPSCKSRPFIADFVAISAKDGLKVAGKLYSSRPKFRVDIISGAARSSILMDGSTQTTYLILHEQHKYLQITENNSMSGLLPKFGSAFDPVNPCAGRPDSHCEQVGTDMVNGRTCTKWIIKELSLGTTMLCIDTTLQFPIKTQTPDGSFWELGNIREVLTDPILLEPPHNYERVDFGGPTKPFGPH